METIIKIFQLDLYLIINSFPKSIKLWMPEFLSNVDIIFIPILFLECLANCVRFVSIDLMLVTFSTLPCKECTPDNSCRSYPTTEEASALFFTPSSFSFDQRR